MATPAHLYKLNTVPKTLTALLVNGPGPQMTQLSGLQKMLGVDVKTKMIHSSTATPAPLTKMSTVLRTLTAPPVNGPGPLTIQISGTHRRLGAAVRSLMKMVQMMMVVIMVTMS